MLSPKTRSTSHVVTLFALLSLAPVAVGCGSGGNGGGASATGTDTPGTTRTTPPAPDTEPQATTGEGQARAPVETPPPELGAQLLTDWGGVLERYATADGGFRYAALAASEGDREALLRAVRAVGNMRLDALPGRDAQLAFYLNAYNILTVNAVVARLPIDGVMTVPGFFDAIEHDVLGTSMTLNALENDIIRGQFHEPRIHFAVNCASVGCPWLDGTPFTAENLEGSLDRLTRAFVARTTSLDSRRRRLVVSQLFEWFATDFEPMGGVRAFLVAHTDHAATRTGVADERYRIAYFPYDWALNARQ